MIISFDDQAKNGVEMIKTLRDSVQRATSIYEGENDTRVGIVEKKIDSIPGETKGMIQEALGGLLVVTDEETDSLTLNAGSYWATAQSLSISKSGYTPLGIVGQFVKGTNATFINLARATLSENNDAVLYRGRNSAAESDYSGTISFYVLWIKNL